MNDLEIVERKWAGLDPWEQSFGNGMERRGADGLSWYDLSLLNCLPCEKDHAIIVTSWSGQLKWLKHTLKSYRETGALVLLAYDHHFFPWVEDTKEIFLKTMPRAVHYQLATSVVFKHSTADAPKRNGWFWIMRYAQGILKQFPNIKTIYTTNGDCVFENPKGYNDLLKLVEDVDLISGQVTESGTIHTANVLFKRKAFDQCVDYMTDLMRYPVIGSRSAEVNLKEAVDQLKLKLGVPAEMPRDTDGTVDPYARFGNDSTWKKMVGFRNLFAEYEQAANDGLELDWLKKHVDDFEDWLYWSGDERSTICKYWETGDRRWLMKFWDHGEESDYNRIYYPVEYYGKEPIYE